MIDIVAVSQARYLHLSPSRKLMSHGFRCLLLRALVFGQQPSTRNGDLARTNYSYEKRQKELAKKKKKEEKRQRKLEKREEAAPQDKDQLPPQA